MSVTVLNAPDAAVQRMAWSIAAGQSEDKRVTMAEIVLRVRLVGGEHLDVSYEEPDTVDEGEIKEHVISLLALDSGVLRTRHGDRLIVLYGRGVAALEVAPRGAVL
jgi:hypothetical protein